jgi:hypothetical protein
MAKTKPTGVRFDEDEIAFVRARTKLNTPQSIVSFLMREYCKMYRVEKPSVFMMPENEVEESEIHKNPYFGISVEQPKKFKQSFENFQLLKVECDNEEDWAKLAKEIREADHLSNRQKVLLGVTN